MPYGKIRVIEGLLASDPAGRVEREQTREQIEREWVGLRIQIGEGDPGLDGKGSNVLLRLQQERNQCQPLATRPFKGNLEARTLGDPTRLSVSSDGVPRKWRIWLSWST
jgi:hypothetical protein